MQSSPPETRASLILRLKNADDVAAWNDFVAIYAPVIFRVADTFVISALLIAIPNTPRRGLFLWGMSVP